MPEQCPYPCKQEEDLKENCSFQGKVLAKLEAIEKSIAEMKINGKDEVKDVWGAINSLRDDIKSLYWKVGFISGGAALVVSIVVHLIKR